MPAERQRTVIDILTRMSGGQQTRREAEKTSGSISKIGATAKRSQGHVNRLAGSLTHGLVGAAAIGFGAVATGLVLGTKKGLAFNATIENSVARFGVFTDTAADAKRLFADIQTLNTKSTFGLGELAGATAYLGNAGLKVSKLPQTMAGIANAVAAAGGGNDELQRAAVALGQMAQNGVASREELNQLTEAGVSVGFLREELGLSAKEYKNLGDQGISSNKVIDILVKNWTTGKIGKAAAAQAKTFSGQLANLGDQLDQVLGAVTKPLFDLLRDKVFPQLLTWGNRFIEIFNPRYDFGENLRLALDQFAYDIVPTVVGELGKIVDAAKAAGLDKKFGTMLAGGLDAAAPEIGNALGAALGVAIPFAIDTVVETIKSDPSKMAPLAAAIALALMGPAGFSAVINDLMAGGKWVKGKTGKGKGGLAAGLLGTRANPMYVVLAGTGPGGVDVGEEDGKGKGLKGLAAGAGKVLGSASRFLGLTSLAIGVEEMIRTGSVQKGIQGADPTNILELLGLPSLSSAEGLKQYSGTKGFGELWADIYPGPRNVGSTGFPDTSEMSPTPQGFNFTVPVYIDGKEIARANHREVRRKEAQR